MIKSTSKNKKSCTLRNEKKYLNKLNLKKEINYNKLKNWREDLH